MKVFLIGLTCYLIILAIVVLLDSGKAERRARIHAEYESKRLYAARYSDPF